MKNDDDDAYECETSTLKDILTSVCFSLRPYHVEHTGSRPITEVKQHRAESVLGRVTTWEHSVP